VAKKGNCRRFEACLKFTLVGWMKYGQYSQEERVYMEIVNCAQLHNQAQVHVCTNENSDCFINSCKTWSPKILENWGLRPELEEFLSAGTADDSEPEGLSYRQLVPNHLWSPACTNYFIQCTSIHFTLHQVTCFIIVSYSDILRCMKSVLLYMLWNRSWICRTK